MSSVNQPKGRVYWSYIAGHRKVNRVRVYQDRPGGVIRIEWRGNGRRKREVLRAPKTGVPVKDKKLAERAADYAAGKLLEKVGAQTAAELFNHGPSYTFGQLVKAYHEQKAHNPLLPEGPLDKRWSERTTKQQERYRDFWLTRVPKSRHLSAITAPEVEGAVEEEAVRRDWQLNTMKAYLVYLIDAFGYAQRTLKWVDEKENHMTGVRLPSPQPFSPEYSEAEAVAVLDALYRVDLRAAAAGEVAFCSGTRVGSFLEIRAEHVHLIEVDDQVVCAIEVVWDKTRKGRIIILSDRGTQAVQQLLEWPDVKRTGWLFPSQNRGELPISDTKMREFLHQAEVLAGVPTVKGRAYHAFKRTFATADILLEDATLQSGTIPQTLRLRYRKENLRRQLRAVAEINRVRSLAPKGGAD